MKQPENISMSGCLLNEAELVPDLHPYADTIFKEINPDGGVKEKSSAFKEVLVQGLQACTAE